MKRAVTPKNPMTRKALTALREAVAQVVEEHRREGRPLAVWQDGKAVLVSAGKPVVVRETQASYRTRAAGKKSQARYEPQSDDGRRNQSRAEGETRPKQCLAQTSPVLTGENRGAIR